MKKAFLFTFLHLTFYSFLTVAQIQNEETLQKILTLLTQAESDEDKLKINQLIAIEYQKKGVLDKTNKYFKASYIYADKLGRREEKISILNALAENYIASGNYAQALSELENVHQLHKIENNKDKQLETLQLLAKVATLANEEEKAILLNKQIVDLAEEVDNPQAKLEALNLLGYIAQKSGQIQNAQNYFLQALTEIEGHSKQELLQQRIDILNNLGSSFTFQRQFNTAISYYEKALKLEQEAKNTEGEAKVLNYIAATNYINGNNEEALESVEKAIALEEYVEKTKALENSYKILSEIYAVNDEFKLSQQAFKKHLKLKEDREKEAEQQKKKRLEKEMYAERMENNLKQTISQKREQQLALQSAKLEAEKKEKELKLQDQQLALLQREKELQKSQIANQALEEKRVKQALEIAQAQLEKQTQEEAYKELKRQKKLKELVLREKELQEKERKKAFEVVVAEKKLQEERLITKERNQKYFIAVIIVFLIFAVFISYALIQRNKSNKLLKSQQKVISVKNEELQASEEELKQNLEELQTTQDQLADNAKLLEFQFQTVTKSINYAQNIQNAVLPTPTERATIFPEHFLVFLPKDIVSGDFYWFSEYDDKKIAAVIDCTGHGVPGAFMSLVGNNILNEVIYQSHISNPALILQNLHREVRKRLSQGEGANNDGMDMGLCTFEPFGDKKIKVQYAGAKNRLFVRNGQLLEFKGDRQSIGGRYSEKERVFKNHEFYLSKGDMLYLTTDGFIDQANPDRKRFSTGKFRNLIEEAYKLDATEQENIFAEALSNHKQDADQRDDITLVGIRV